MKERNNEEVKFKNPFTKHIHEILEDGVKNGMIKNYFIQELIPVDFLPAFTSFIPGNYFSTIGVQMNEDDYDLSSVRKILGLKLFEYITLFKLDFASKKIKCLASEERPFVDDKDIYRCVLVSGVGCIQVFSTHDEGVLNNLHSNLDKLPFPKKVTSRSKKIENFEQTMKQKNN